MRLVPGRYDNSFGSYKLKTEGCLSNSNSTSIRLGPQGHGVVSNIKLNLKSNGIHWQSNIGKARDISEKWWARETGRKLGKLRSSMNHRSQSLGVPPCVAPLANYLTFNHKLLPFPLAFLGYYMRFKNYFSRWTTCRCPYVAIVIRLDLMTT